MSSSMVLHHVLVPVSVTVADPNTGVSSCIVLLIGVAILSIRSTTAVKTSDCVIFSGF